MLQSFPSLVFAGNPDLTKLVDAVSKTFRRLLAVPLLDGVLLKSVALGPSAPTLVSHGLGRAIVGWWVVDITAPAKVYRPASTAPESILPLQADAATTVAVWVF